MYVLYIYFLFVYVYMWAEKLQEISSSSVIHVIYTVFVFLLLDERLFRNQSKPNHSGFSNLEQLDSVYFKYIHLS